MRRRILLIVFSCILLILSLVIFDRINARNAAPMPVPSVSGGYYENGFTLRLTAPSNGSIYYTTDGSTPTADSTLYQDGIPLKNRSSEQNLYNSVQNVVTDWKNYTPDPQPVEKGTVIRAVFVNERDIASEILTQTYFIGPSLRNGATRCRLFLTTMICSARTEFMSPERNMTSGI